MKDLEIMTPNGEFIPEDQYIKELEEKKYKWVNKRKLALLVDLILMRIGQGLVFIGELAIFYYIWLNFTNLDILYLIGWWLVLGSWTSYTFVALLGQAIKSYKNHMLKKIYREANKKFKKFD